MTDPFLEIFGGGDSRLVCFEAVVTRGLLPLRDVIHDRGAKAGESLHEHLVGGAVLIDGLADLLGLDDCEARLCMAAFAVHDLNKFPDAGRRSFRDLCDDRHFVDAAFTLAKLDEFLAPHGGLTALREDVLLLVRNHGGHYPVSGQLLVPAADRTVLGTKALDRLVAVLTAADVVDLSRTLEERTHKQTFLDKLNAVRSWKGRGPLVLAAHRVAEDRGLLANVLHNAVRGVLVDLGATPLLAYADGFVYALPAECAAAAPADAALLERAATALRARIARCKAQAIRRLLKKREIGVTIDPSLLGTAPATEVVAEVAVLARRGRLPEGGVEAKLRGRADGARVVDDLLAAGLHLPTDDACMQKGELVRALLGALGKGKALAGLAGASDPWAVLYGRLDVPEALRKQLEPLKPLHDRPFVLAANLTATFEEIQGRFVDAWAETERLEAHAAVELAEDGSVARADGGPLELWVREVLTLRIGDRDVRGETRFADYLDSATSGNARCCFGPTRGTTSKLMKGEVPNALKVQQFSNRLPGGGGEPKRDVCPVCREAWRLERLALPVGAEKSVYVHLVPGGWLPAHRLEEIHAALDRIAPPEEGPEAPAGEPAEPVATPSESATDKATDRYVVERSDEGGDELRVPVRVLGGPGTRGVALGLPRASETLGPTLVLPLAAGKEASATGVRLLAGLRLAGRVARALGMGLVLSESPVLVARPSHPGGAILDGLPSRLTRFVGGRELDARTLERLVQDLTALGRVEQLVRPDPAKPDPEHLVQLAVGLGDEGLGVLAILDDLLERRVGGADGAEWKAARQARDLLPLVRGLLASRPLVDARLTDVERLATVAREARLDADGGLKRGPTLAPLDAVFDHLRRDSAPIDVDAALAAAAADVTDHVVRRMGDGAGKRAHEGATRLVEGVGALLREQHGGRRHALLAEVPGLRAAFLLMFRASAFEAAERAREARDAEVPGEVKPKARGPTRQAKTRSKRVRADAAESVAKEPGGST